MRIVHPLTTHRRATREKSAVQLIDSVAVVTGAGSGLGTATVRHLVHRGARAVLVDLPGSAGADVAGSLGGNALFAAADVTDDAAVAAAFDTARALGSVRVVVNCAGVATPGRVLDRRGEPAPLGDFVKVVSINLIGTFNVVRGAAAAMARTEPVDGERGVIVNTASIAAFDGQIGQAANAASKSGVVGMTLPLARELAGRLIRVASMRRACSGHHCWPDCRPM